LKGHVGFTEGKNGKSYFYKFSIMDIKGKRRTLMKRGFKSEKEAEEAQTLRMAGFLTGDFTATPEKTTLIEYVRRWFKNHKLARTSRAGYRNIIENHIAKDPIGNILVSKIQCSTIDDYYARRQDEADLGDNTLRRHRAILRPVLDRAVHDGLLKTNPERFCKLRKPRKYKPATYDEDQVAEMLKELRDEEIYPGALVAAFGALRRGEDLGTTWDDFDPDRKTLRIERAYYVVERMAGYDDVKNDNSNDFVDLDDFAVSELKRIKKEQMKMKLRLGTAYQDNNLIVCQLDGRPWNPSTFSHKFGEALYRHGLPHIRLHDLRHSHATILHEHGADAGDIAVRLRETLQVVVSTYIHDKNRRRKVADTFGKAIYGPKKNPRRNRGNQV
jgi:integrase